jgi:AcrR family transcriptional regulator
MLELVPNRATGLDWGRVIEEAPLDRSVRGSRGVGLSTQAIVEAAIVVADQDGLDAVSIRRVAALLGVRPMSLYTHITSKDELLDLMANELVGLMLIDPPPTGGWRSELSAIARRSHITFVAHPWVLAAFARRPRPGPNAALHAKQMARAVRELELEASEMWIVLGIVDDYVLGHALRVATSGNARDLDAALTTADLAEVPELSALPSVDLARATSDSFETGLQTVLDGVARRFQSSSERSSPTGSSTST